MMLSTGRPRVSDPLDGFLTRINRFFPLNVAKLFSFMELFIVIELMYDSLSDDEVIALTLHFEVHVVIYSLLLNAVERWE